MPATTATVGGQAGSRRNAPGTRRSILAAALAHLLPRSRALNQAITAALLRAALGPGSTARARAAYAAATNGTLALLSATHGRLTPAARAELLAAATRAFGPPPPGQAN